MGSGASAVTVDQQVNDAITGAVMKYIQDSPPKAETDTSGSGKSFKDRLRPLMLKQKTLRSFAIKNHEKEKMGYLPQDPVMSGFANRPVQSAANNLSMKKIGSSHSNSVSTLIIIDKSLDRESGGDTPPKRPGMGLKLNLGLKLALTEDEADWIQVSEDEEDAPLSPRRNKMPLLSMDGSGLAAKQSLMFTQSGTIFVDGFSEGIGKDGIHIDDGGSNFLITERIVLVCNLGQGASGTVYKALDLSEMRIVAVKCISVFERGKRRQMVRELGALFEMLHSAEMSPRSLGTTPRGEAQPKVAKSTPKAVEFTDIIRRTSIQSDDGNTKLYKNPKEHIVDFYDAFSNLEDGGVALMMEYMDGGSLQDIVDAGGVDDEGTLASIAFQVLSGLHFLHQFNQMHRDIKPANILINHDGLVKVSDLGILKKIDPIEKTSAGEKAKLPTIHSMDLPNSPSAADRSTSSAAANYEGEVPADMTVDSTQSSGKRLDIDDGEMYRANTFVGTVTYMAPERIDSRPYTFNSDIWSFGLTLLAVSLGKLPIDNANGFWSVLNAVRDKPPPQVPEGGHWSDEFRDFIRLCLTKSPMNRPSCAELLKHPFVQRAVPDHFEEDSDTTARGKKELRAIIFALHTHLVNLREEYSHCSDKNNSGNSINNHLLAQAIDARGVDEVLRLLVFGREPTHKPEELLQEGTHTAHRLSQLSRQLHLPLQTVLEDAKAICSEILMNRNDSALSAMMGITTPSRESISMQLTEEEKDATPPPMKITDTPKARHDHSVTIAPTPKARHDLR